MATVTRTRPTETDDGLVPYRVTIRQYKTMIGAGIFPEGAGRTPRRDRRDEGRPTVDDVGRRRPRLSVQHPAVFENDGCGGAHRRHEGRITRGRARRDHAEIRPAQLDRRSTRRSAPRSGRAGMGRPRGEVGGVRQGLAAGARRRVARGPDDRYRVNDPTAKDLALVAEVSVSSYPGDRGVKWHGYAAAKVPVYWVVNLNRRRVEVYSGPSGRGKTARYRDVDALRRGRSVPVVLDGRELGTIAVAEILP